MDQQHKCLFDFQAINNIISVYQTFFIKQNQVIELDDIREKGDGFLQYVNQQLLHKDGQINQITNKSIQIFKVLIKQQYFIHSKILQFENTIQEKNNAIQNFKYSKKVYEQKIQERQLQIQKLKNQMNYLQEKFIQQQKKIKRQNKQIKKTFRQVQEYNQQEKQILDDIQFQNQNLKIQVQKIQEDNCKIEEELKSLKQRQELILKQLQSSKCSAEWQIKQRIPLQQQVGKQKSLIQKLKKQIDDLKVTLKNPFQRIQRINFDDKQYEQYMLYPKHIDNVVKLSEQLPNKQIYDISADNFDNYYRRLGSLRRSFDQVSVSQGRQSFLQRAKDSFLQKQSENLMPTADKYIMEQSNSKQQQLTVENNTNAIKKLFMPDPYFAHFILTSQSVKIKQDCQQMLNIDIKPFYKQIVQKRIPMHLWDQWTRNKLIQLVKKRQTFDQ